MGALTREARAEERVAEKMPAVMRGEKPDTIDMTCQTKTTKAKILDYFWVFVEGHDTQFILNPYS